MRVCVRGYPASFGLLGPAGDSVMGYRYPNSEKPHVFPEATYDVAVQNTCGFSMFTLADA